MSDKLREKLKISEKRLKEINDFLLDSNNSVINDLLKVVGKYGGPEEINRKAEESRKLPNLLNRLKEIKSPYLKDVEWLIEQRDSGAFIPVADYRKNILGNKSIKFNEENPVTLEISALQYFPFLIEEAKQSIKNKEIMPGRFIRVRKMKEQEGDNGDILAVAAAMEIIGASYVETLDTKGTDGSNIHLCGPETITGYFGGVGQPNEHALQWIDEFLYYYTNYGIKQVLNINPGTVMLAYLLHKLGVHNEFKISVFMGNDNPYAALWTLMGAKLFAGDDGKTSLIGFNWSNSVDNKTIEVTSEIRKSLGLEDNVRFEHHITETWRSIVKQPYNRREELLELAEKVPNISAKHEGGEEEDEKIREHSSDILDYFRTKEEVEATGHMKDLLKNYMDKHRSVNLTAKALTEKGLSFIAAKNLHK
ncbi:MAG: hypothetical protein ABRQ37_17585 [Candidatus Eremiobacterota bacterium]